MMISGTSLREKAEEIQLMSRAMEIKIDRIEENLY